MPGLPSRASTNTLVILAITTLIWIPAGVMAQSDSSSSPTSLPGENQRQLESSVNDARQLESAGDFVGAQRVWKQIADSLAQKYGEDAWQATNARLEAQTAGRRSTFDASGHQTVQSIRQLQVQSAEAVEQGNWQSAAELADQAYARTVELFGEKSHEAARVKTQTAHLALSAGQSQRAWHLYREALVELREIVGVNHPEIEALNYSIGNLLQINNQHETAIPWLSQSVTISKQVFGDQSPVYADRMSALGVSLHQTGKSEEAIGWLAAADAIQQSALGATHPRRAGTLLDLGIASLAAGRNGEGRQSLTTASEIFASSLGDRHPQTLSARTQLATALVLNGEVDNAEAALRSVLAARTAAENPDPIATADTCFKLAVLVGRQQKMEECEQLLRRALDAQRQHLGAGHPHTQRSVSALVTMLEKTGRNSEAGPLRAQLNATARQDEAGTSIR